MGRLCQVWNEGCLKKWHKWITGLVVLTALSVMVIFHPDRQRWFWRVPGPHSRIVVPVFVLHRVFPGQATEYIISPNRLDALLEELNSRGFTPIKLRDLQNALAGQGALPERPAMVTFDDTYLDNFTYALPVLKARGWTAVFFAPTGKLTEPPEQRMTFGDGPEPLMMQWPEIRALKSAGMEIGSHSVNHINLSRAGIDTVRMELEQSRRMLEERLGSEPIALAYPGGRQNGEVRAVAHDVGYTLAFLSSGGPIQMHEQQDMLRLPRVHVPGYIDPRTLVRAIPRNDWRNKPDR